MRDFATAKSAAETEGTEKAKKFRKQARKAILGFVSVVLIIFGTYYFTQWMKESPDVSSASRQAAGPSRICPNVSSRATVSCLITSSDWSNWFQFAHGARDNGKQVCASLGLTFERKEENGVTFWRLKARSGEIVAQYRLFPADVKCSEVFP